MKYNMPMATMRDIMNRKLKRMGSGISSSEIPLLGVDWQRKKHKEEDWPWRKLKLEWRPFLESLGVLAITTGVAALLDNSFLENNNVSIIYTLAVVIIASITPGYIYGIIGSIISVIGVNYFFASPRFAFNFTQTGYPITFASLLVVSIIMSTLMTRYREAAHIARMRETRTKTLYELTNEFLAADDAESFVQIACEYLSRVCGTKTCYAPEGTELPKDVPVCISLPVAVRENRFGTVYVPKAACAATESESLFALMQMIAAHLALALERNRLIQEHRDAQLQAKAEEMRGNLLRAVSHDLRTPLTSIQGASATLLESGEQLGAETCYQLVDDIHENSQWLIRMVENLLSVTKISDGTAAVKKEPEVVEEIVAQAVGQLRKRFPERDIAVRVPDDVLLIPMDATLIEQVLINLTENAFFHADTEAPVEITVLDMGEDVAFRVRDHGTGIDPACLDSIFDGNAKPAQPEIGDAHRGMGIGLSICRAIVRTHRGSIRAWNMPDGGAVFEFTLPKEGAEYEQQNDVADRGGRQGDRSLHFIHPQRK